MDNYVVISSATKALVLETGSTLPPPPLYASAGADKTIGSGGSVQLEGSASGGTPPYSWDWTPPDGLDNPNSQTPIATPTTTTEYTLTVTDSQLVQDSDTAVVTVIVENKLLVPGSGWTGATPEPDPIGSDVGSDCYAIARWDVVPFQSFAGDLNIGVVAFHSNGIDRVEFSVDNGPWSTVYYPSNNSHAANHSDIGVTSDGVTEYWATLRASSFNADKLVEVRAIAYPTVGKPRVLDSLYLFALPYNSVSWPIRYVDSVNGSDTYDGTSPTYVSGTTGPKASIVSAMNSARDGSGRVDGLSLRLLPGTYVAGPATYPRAQTWYRWLTIEPYGSTARSEVIMAENPVGGLYTHLVHMRNVTLHGRQSSTTAADGPAGPNTNPTLLWLDRCKIEGVDELEYIHWTPTWIQIYITDCDWTHTVYGSERSHLSRHNRWYDMQFDPHNDALCIINCTVDGLDGSEYNAAHPGGELHADGAQWNGIITPHVDTNVIVYGYDVRHINAQMFIVGSGTARDRTWNDIAFINWTCDSTGANPALSAQFCLDTNNMLIQNCSFTGGQPVLIRDNGNTGEASEFHNLTFLNNTFYRVNITNTGNNVAADPTNRFAGNTYLTGTNWDA